MISNQDNPALMPEATPESLLLEKSQAPTLRDLRPAAEELMAKIAAEIDSASPHERNAQPAN